MERKFLISGLAVVAAAAVAIPIASAGTSDSGRESAKPAAAKANIVQTAVKAGQFDTLVSLVKKAGLARTLSGKTSYTVFAPTDAAFRKVPKATLDALARDRAQLRAVLLYHVVKGKVGSKRVVGLRSVKTVQGSTAAVRLRGGKVYVDGARVVTPDVAASNGIIHVVNKVMLP